MASVCVVSQSAGDADRTETIGGDSQGASVSEENPLIQHVFSSASKQLTDLRADRAEHRCRNADAVKQKSLAAECRVAYSQYV